MEAVGDSGTGESLLPDKRLFSAHNRLLGLKPSTSSPAPTSWSPAAVVAGIDIHAQGGSGPEPQAAVATRNRQEEHGASEGQAASSCSPIHELILTPLPVSSTSAQSSASTWKPVSGNQAGGGSWISLPSMKTARFF